MVENKCMENKNTTKEEAQYFKFEPNECFVKFIPGEPVGRIKPFGGEEFETDAATERIGRFWESVLHGTPITKEEYEKG